MRAGHDPSCSTIIGKFGYFILSLLQHSNCAIAGGIYCLLADKETRTQACFEFCGLHCVGTGIASADYGSKI